MTTELWLALETCRDCWGRGAYVGLEGCALEDAGNCSGGIAIGDLERLREDRARERLRDRL